MSAPKLLQDIRILCTNLSSRERDQIQRTAAQQGAVALAAAAAHDPPHVVITRRAGSPKYLAVLKRNPATPVVTPEWLNESVRVGQRLGYEGFRAPAFCGLLVCFSGLTIAQKNELAAAVLAQGGSHSPSLHADCTHLVTTSTDSDKFRFAVRSGIPCVTPRWLADSAAAGWAQDERQYGVAAVGAALHRQASLAPPESDSGPTSTALPPPARPSSALDATVSDTFRGAEASQLRSTLGGGTQAGTSRLAREGHATSSAAADAAVSPAPAPAWDDLDCDDDAPLFLDCCSLWVVGCTAAEAFDALKLCRRGGAKRYIDPPPGVITHVVVGSQLGAGEADQVARYAADNRHAAVVRLEWLRRSDARREALPADERFALAPGALAGGRRCEPAAGLAAPSDAAPGGLERGGSGVDGGGALLSRQASGALGGGGGGFLEACYFTLAAVRGTPEEAASERIIRAHGGRLFSASLPGRVAAGQARAFAVCPPSLPPTAAAAVRACNPDFGAVPEAGRFTLYWLQCCEQAGQVLPLQRGSPCYSPLPYALPLPGMEHVSVAISGFEPTVRAAIQRTVELVGGRVSVDFMSSRDTHLVVAAARGEKHRHAGRMGVVPVTADWLVDSVTQGRLQPEANYRPRAPPGAAQQQPQAGAAQARAGSGSGPSQVGATQAGTGAAGFASLFQAAGSRPPPPQARPLREREPQLAAAAPAAPPRQQRPDSDENAAGAGREAARPASQECPHLAAASTAAAPTLGLGLDELLALVGVGARHTTAAAATLDAAPPPAPAPVKPAATPAAQRSGGAHDAPASSGRGGGSRGKRSGAKAAPRLGSGGESAPGSDPAAHTDGEGSPGEGDGAELAAALDDVSSLLDKVRARDAAAAAAAGGTGSQHDMPPPPPRRTAAAGADAGGMGPGGRRGRGGKRPTADAAAEAAEAAVRRSSRPRVGSQVESDVSMEMSQRVGYDEAPAAEAVGPGAGPAAAAAKQRLRAVTRQRSSSGSSPKNALDSL